MLRNWQGAIFPGIVFVIWELAGHMDDLKRDSLSQPSDIFVALYSGLLDGTIFRATAQTFEAALLGFFIASLVGVLVGIGLRLAPRIERIVGPTIDLLRPIPSVALIPLTLMIYGFGVRMEAAVVAFACIWPVLIVTISAVRSIEPGLIEVAKVLEMQPFERIRKIVLPAAFGRIAVGLQLALSISLVVAVTVEIVLNPRGLGHSMMNAQQALRFDVMYAQLLWIGLVGWALSHYSQKLINKWSPAFQAAKQGDRS